MTSKRFLLQARLPASDPTWSAVGITEWLLLGWDASSRPQPPSPHLRFMPSSPGPNRQRSRELFCKYQVWQQPNNQKTYEQQQPNPLQRSHSLCFLLDLLDIRPPTGIHKNPCGMAA